MTTAVSICNLALGHLGDGATVSSIDPPEASSQAEYCAQFYPIARDQMLELHDWNFATRRIAAALLATDPWTQWRFAYEVPSDALRVFSVLPSDAVDDQIGPDYQATATPTAYLGPQETAQDFEIETDAAGRRVLLCNVEDAILRYTVPVTDTTRFSPLFVTALSYLLAGYLAGPILKGETGRNVAGAMSQQALGWIGQAAKSDAGQRRANRVRDLHTPAWIRGR
jgi:hypothetical protein